MNTFFLKFKSYLSMVKFAHTIFAMPFALLGFFMGVSSLSVFKWDILLMVIGCMIFARNSAMGFNRFIDRRFDAANQRTANREIPAGIIRPGKALVFVIFNSLFFIITTYFLNDNKLAFYLSPVALIVILGYSLCKRFTSMSHLVLGLGLALAPIGAYIAVCGKFDFLPLLLSFMVLFWVSGFDIIYALQDIDFDKSQKLKSIPTRLGIKNSLVFSSFLHLLSFLLIITIGFLGDWRIYYWIGGGIFSFLLLYQHLIVKVKDLTRINLAFFTTNGIASLIFGVFAILDLLQR
ncbi:MAG: UbiA-like polyprenyltransferase [Bacteroidales bacterium]